MLSVQTGLEARPTPHGYWEDPDTGLWFKADATRVSFPLARDLPDLASEDLAKSLWRNVAKEQPRALYDVGPSTLALPQAWTELSQEPSQASRHLYQDIPEMYPWGGGPGLVTYIHTWQRMSYVQAQKELDALAATRSDLLVFIRLPDREVAGFERDLKPEIIDQNQCAYTVQSMLELLYRNGHFEVIETYPLEPGQRDWVLRRVDKRPSVCVGMIAKNEARDLPVLLESLKDLELDGFCLIDTGSKDETLSIAETAPAKVVWTDTYTGASKQDPQGDWKLWDFGKARNQYVQQIEARGFDWVLWMDADDEVLTPNRLRRLSIWTQYGLHGIMMEGGGPRWPHHRLLRTKRGIQYKGRCHEYPDFAGQPSIVHSDIVIRHNAAPGAGENSNARNRRILELEMREEPTTRTAFYLGQTYHHGSEPVLAVEAYTTRIQMGFGYEDEYWFAHLYRARCALEAGRTDDALKFVREAVVGRPDWAEFWMLGAGIEMHKGRYWRAIGFALQAKDMPIPHTHLWREADKYTDQPYRVISWCYEHLGEWERALEWARLARDRIGAYDADWEKRIERIEAVLRGKGTALIKKPQTGGTHVWHRPGALGDVLMTLNLVNRFCERHRPDRLLYRCAPGTKALLEPILLDAGFDEVVSEPVPDAKEWNLIGYPLHEGYPEKPMRQHLLKYFAEEMGLDLEGILPRAQFSVPEHIQTLPRYCTIHPKAGWSPYKNWPMDRWEKVVQGLKREGIPVVQLGGSEDPVIPGVESKTDLPFLQQFQLLLGAKLHLGVDSWTNHARFFEAEPFRPRRTLILWGSTQASAAGYPTATNLSANISCQPCFKEDPKISQMSRGPCTNLNEAGEQACMAAISVETVLQEVERLWN